MTAHGHYLWPPRWFGESPFDGGIPGAKVVRSPADKIAERDVSVNLKVCAFRDGLFAFDFSGWSELAPPPPASVQDFDPVQEFESLAEKAIQRARVMNVHLACLLATPQWVFEARPISPTNTLRVSFDDGSFQGSSDPIQTQLALTRRNLRTNDSWVARRDGPPPIPVDALAASFELLEDLLDQPNQERFSRRVELLLRAGAAFQAHDHELAVVNAWTVLEALLGDEWDAYITEQRADVQINAKRRKKLKSSGMTAWHRSETLSLAGRIPPVLFEKLELTRKKRNDFLHKEDSISSEDAQTGILAAQEMFERVYGKRIEIPLSRQVSP